MDIADAIDVPHGFDALYKENVVVNNIVHVGQRVYKVLLMEKVCLLSVENNTVRTKGIPEEGQN